MEAASFSLVEEIQWQSCQKSTTYQVSSLSSSMIQVLQLNSLIFKDASKDLAFITQSIQNTIDSAISKSCFVNLFVAFTMNKIYRSINALQVVFLLPLMNIALNGNIEIIFVFFETNTNKDFDCNQQNKVRPGEKSIKSEEGFYSFSNEQPFSDEFEAQGYESHEMASNIGSTINNIQKVTFVTLGSLIFVYIIVHIAEKQFSWLIKVTDMFHYSYIQKFLTTHALRLLTFSFINLTLTPDFDAAYFTSYILSLLFTLSIFGLTIFSAIKVYMTPQNQLISISKDNPKILFLFKELKTKKSALMFWPVFLLRRIALAFIVTALKDYQALQLTFLVVQSFVMTGYLTIVMPFESISTNILEILNEQLIQGTILHLFPFSDAYDTDLPTRNTAGWTFLGFVAAQIIINLVIKAAQIMIKLRVAFLKWYEERKLKMNKIKKEDTQQKQLMSINILDLSINGIGARNTELIKGGGVHITEINRLDHKQNPNKNAQNYYQKEFRYPDESNNDPYPYRLSDQSPVGQDISINDIGQHLNDQEYQKYVQRLPIALRQANFNSELLNNQNRVYHQISKRDYIISEESKINRHNQQEDNQAQEEEKLVKEKLTLKFITNGFQQKNIPFFMRKK